MRLSIYIYRNTEKSIGALYCLMSWEAQTFDNTEYNIKNIILVIVIIEAKNVEKRYKSIEDNKLIC